MGADQISLLTWLPPLLLAAMLVAAAMWDLRKRIIPNRLNLAIALTAPIAWIASGLDPWPDIAIQIGLAALIFGLFVGLFMLGGIGGGDVKLIGAVALWIPADLLMPMLILMAIAGGVIALAMLLWRALSRGRTSAEVPYGVAIAFAGLWAIHQQYLNHYSLTAFS